MGFSSPACGSLVARAKGFGEDGGQPAQGWGLGATMPALQVGCGATGHGCKRCVGHGAGSATVILVRDVIAELQKSIATSACIVHSTDTVHLICFTHVLSATFHENSRSRARASQGKFSAENVPMSIFQNLRKAFSEFLGETDDRTLSPLYYLFLCAMFLVLTMMIVVIYVNPKESGQWGDLFGGFVTPILTFLTFMGLLITITTQKKELKETREELKRSTEALLSQHDAINRQIFESTFF